ncbi:MAG: single-stranded-DNA-specific exonuclease RecJ, partial [Halanaerobiales bacterium]
MILESKYSNSNTVDNKKVRQISNKLDIDYKIIQLMFLRGFKTQEQIEKFLKPTTYDLKNPYEFKDMKLVVEKIRDAIKNNKRILIFGDYDVDGMSATAILYLHLKSLNAKVDYFLPNRYVDGYGLTKEVIDKLIERKSPELLITVDCGITSKDEVDYAKTKDIDVVVTDHHEEIEGKKPNCPIVNPKVKDDNYSFDSLCGAGVAFMLVEAISGRKEAFNYIDIAALATIADIVELKDENRAIAKLGIDKLVENPNIGLKVLSRKLKLDFNKTDLISTDIAFKIAPKINSAGRLGTPEKGLDLLITKDKKLIHTIASDLIEINEERQRLCNNIYSEAIDKLNRININNISVIVLSDSNWDAGLLGIIAARLSQEYNRPTILFSEVGNKYKGSARSINNINIHKAIQCVDVNLDAFGGHTMAAGLTVDKKVYKKFREQTNKCVLKEFDYSDFLPRKKYDLELSISQINIDFIKQINLLKPFGLKNEMPVFKINFKNKNPKKMKNHPQHILFNLNNNIDLISFNDYSSDIYYNHYKNKNAL